MGFRGLFLILLIHLISWIIISGQDSDSVFILNGIVYDEAYQPVPASHIINMNTRAGDVTDSLGIFNIPVHRTDTLLVRNIAFRDTLVSVDMLGVRKIIRIRPTYYLLREVKIFEWGSNYDDFRKAVIEMPDRKTLGESLGLQRQDPDYIPLEMDEEAVKNPLLLLHSPVTFFYYNYNKHVRSARKVYWLKKNRDKQLRFDSLMSLENLKSITGLSGVDLMRFRSYLYQAIQCDMNCTDLQVYEEIYQLWETYRKLENPAFKYDR